MTKAQKIWAEVQQEALATRKILESVPMEKADWKPHEKSMALGHLARHVAEIPGWYQECLVNDELDFAAGDFTPVVLESNEALMAHFDKNMSRAEEILNSFPDEKIQDPWTMRQGEMIFFTMPKEQVVRTWCLNHWYHHRAQLGVYLRLLDIPVPATYGPSADYQG